LAPADINADGAPGPSLEHDIGKPSGGRPNIEKKTPFGGDGEFIEGSGEFEPSPANVGAGVFLYGNVGIGGKCGTGLVGQDTFNGDAAGEDEALSPLSARGETPLDEQAVKAFALRHVL
jgi:hypothetical protein